MDTWLDLPHVYGKSLFEGNPFPALPTLLPSASDLVNLRLDDIPESGYISPEALVACLAVLPRLSNLFIKFQLPISHHDRILLPPETWIVLPRILSLEFTALHEFLEDLVARVDTPQLKRLTIQYLDRLDFRVPQLSKFVNRLDLNLFRLGRARVYLGDMHREVSSLCHESTPLEPGLVISVLGVGINQQVSRMPQVLGQIPFMLSDVIHLDIEAGTLLSYPQDDIAWVELLHPFTALVTLRVSQELTEGVALAFKGVAEATDLPRLRLEV